MGKKLFKINLFFVFIFQMLIGFSYANVCCISEVIDGDTIQIQDGTMWYRARLAYLDCPEKDQPFGDLAREYLFSELQEYTEVDVIQLNLDGFNRPLVLIFKDGICLNLFIVKSGLAEVYRDITKKEKENEIYKLILMCEKFAKDNKRGMWGIEEQDYISPKQWRKMNKDQKIKYNFNFYNKYIRNK